LCLNGEGSKKSEMVKLLKGRVAKENQNTINPLQFGAEAP